MSIADTAVGAILEIPSKAMARIKQANDALLTLHESSVKAANQIYGDFNDRIPRAFDKFIQKIREASGVIDGINGKTVNINMSNVEQSMTQAANTTQTQTQRISDAVQDMGRLPIDFSKPKESLESLIATFEQLRAELTHLRSDRERHVAGSSEAQNLNNVIEALKEYIALKEKSNAQLARATTPSDKAILDEQKALMTQILQLTKDINAENKKQEREKALGRTIPQEDIDRLRKYREDLEKLNISYDTLKSKIDGMSAGGAKLFNEADVRNSLTITREQSDAQEKLNQALQMTAKLTSDVKLKGGNVTSSEYGVYRNEQVTVYAQMIEMIKKKGEVEAQVASQGYAQTAAQTNLLQTIEAEYKRLESTLASVTGKYLEIDRAVKSAFEHTKTMQEAENASKLADAQKKAEASAAQLTAEYKKLDAEFKKLNKSLDQYNDKIAGKQMAPAQGQALESSANAIAYRMADIATRMREIERKNIDEVNAYRQQKDMEANQKSISDYIQAEAQKTAASRQAAEERLAKYRASLQEYQGAMRQADAVLSGTGVNHLTTNLENVKRAIADLKAASGKLNLLDPNEAQKAEQLKKKIAELESLLKKYKDAATPDKPVISPQDAINAAKNATTLKQLEKAYKDLKEAMSGVDSSKPIWSQMNTQLGQTKKQIDDIKKKMGEFRNETQRTSNMMGNLQNRIAAAFSVSAILGFAKKVTEVRAQFELQRVALGAIIQDKDEANKVFLRVQQMALESPFSIMQLERATKQVAAFGFEAKSLVPTMKMVADIGAGLGVELDRIVLVLGHMKARGYLEGTMVRQFTNMGFNVLGGLAKYYTELEDRMVSVSEVQDRVKKKMVEFADVEEVMKRVTSAGGMFYDMQKKQADSIWGMMQRITDAYDLMLNDIGKSNEGSIKWALTAVRNLIGAWRDLKPYVVAAVAAMGTYGVVAVGWHVVTTTITGARIAVIALTKGLQAAKTAQQGLNVTMAANPYAAVAAVLMALGVYIWQAVSATSALNEEMERIGSDMTDSLNESIATFNQLANTISDANSTFTERNDAITEMRRVYAEILPQEKMEIGYIQSLNGNYAELTKTIQEYYQNKEYQQKAEAIIGSEEAKAVKNQLQETLEQMNEDGAFDLKYSRAQISSWADTIAKEINTGKIPASLDSLEKRIKEVFNAKDLSMYRAENYGEADLHDVMQNVEKVQKAWGDVQLSTANAENAITTYRNALSRMDMSQLEEAKKNLESQRDSIQRTLGQGLTVAGYGTGFISHRELDSGEIEEYKGKLKAVEEQIAAVDDAQSKWLANQFKDKVEELTNRLNGQVQAYWNLGNQMKTLERQGKKNTTEWDNLAKQQDAARKSVNDMAEEYGTKVNWKLIDSAQTSFELRGELDQLATQAFPKVAQMAVKALDKVREYLLKSQKTLLTWLKNLGNVLPDNLKDKIPGAVKMFSEIDRQLTLTEEQLKALGDAIKGTESNTDKTKESLERLYSNQAKKRVKDAGADISKLNEIVFDADGHLKKGASDTAKNLLTAAKKWREDAQKYQTTTDKKFFLESNKLTEEQIKANEKNAEAAEKLASDLAGVEKKGRTSGGKDEISELWKNRLKLLQDFYKQYEELRKHFGADESLKRAMEAFTAPFETLGMDIDKTVAKGMDKQGLVDNIKEMTDAVAAVRPKLVDEFQKAGADVQIQVDFKLKEDSEEQLKKDIDKMFDNYELSKTFKDIGLNVDLTYMVGGKPTTLGDIRRELNEKFLAEGGKKAAKERVKMYEDAFKRLDEIEHKNQIERIKNYNKYLLESMSERVQIELKAMQEIRKIREDETLDEFSKERAIANRRRKMQEDLAKQVWKEFQGTDSYINMFKDVDKASTNSINRMLKKLEELKGSLKNLPADQVKAIVREMEKLEKVATERNPFASFTKGIKEYISYLQKRGELERKQSVLESQQETTKKNIDETEKLVYALQTQYDAIKNNAKISQKEKDDIKAKLDYQKMYLEMLRKTYKMMGKVMEDINEEMSDGEESDGEMMAAFKKIKAYAEETVGYLDDIISALDQMGLVSDEARDNFESFKEVFEATNQIAEGGIRVISNWGTNWAEVGAGTLQGIAGTFKLIAAAFSIGDKKKERQIKAQQEKVEALEKAYQKLEKSIEKALTFDQYNAEFRKMNQNLESQKAAYQEMIRLEEDKKKTDKEKLKEWQGQIDEINEALEEQRKERIEMMGSINQEDYLDEAANFVDAWLDAYKETGDGLDALSEHWQEFYENLVMKQAASAIISKRMAKYIDRINAAIESNDTGLSLAQTFRQIGENLKSELGVWNEDLKAFFDALGFGGGTGEFVLSDLQKGIQNITEPQAAAIEAYLNSMRFAVFRHTEQLDTLIQIVGAQYGVGIDNPVVTELKGIRIVLDSIDRRLDSVIETKAGIGTVLRIG